MEPNSVHRRCQIIRKTTALLCPLPLKLAEVRFNPARWWCVPLQLARAGHQRRLNAPRDECHESRPARSLRGGTGRVCQVPAIGSRCRGGGRTRPASRTSITLSWPPERLLTSTRERGLARKVRRRTGAGRAGVDRYVGPRSRIPRRSRSRSSGSHPARTPGWPRRHCAPTTNPTVPAQQSQPSRPVGDPPAVAVEHAATLGQTSCAISVPSAIAERIIRGA